jgi:hypothetical protein
MAEPATTTDWRSLVGHRVLFCITGDPVILETVIAEVSPGARIQLGGALLGHVIGSGRWFEAEKLTFVEDLGAVAKAAPAQPVAN